MSTRQVYPMTRCYIMAEIGSNWLGDRDLAFQHIEQAAHAGADGVKFQLFRAADLYVEPPPGLSRFELPLELIPELFRYAREQNVDFCVTPYSPGLADELRDLVDSVKVSAYDLPYTDLLVTVASLGVPVVLSTAMSTPQEIEAALDTMMLDPKMVILLHGTAAYPAPLNTLNLARMRRFQALFPKNPVGLSDHSVGIEGTIAAIHAGARYIEKHVKLVDPRIERDSPDAPHSLPMALLKNIVEETHQSLVYEGSEEAFGPLPLEIPLYETCRRSNAKPRRSIHD